MTEDEKPAEDCDEHWAQPYDSRASSPGAITGRVFHCWAQFAIGRAERTFTDGREACRWMASASNRGASRTGYTAVDPS